MDAAGKPGGFFLTLEGPEGAGKSTQARRLYDRLNLRGYSAFETREPGGTEVGERIRSLLLTPGGPALTPWTEALLFTAARAQLVSEAIVPRLRRGEVVISDRYGDSTLAYQGFGRGLDLLTLRQLQEKATLGLRPNLTFLLDLRIEEGLARIPSLIRDRLDQETREFHRRVRDGYLRMAAEEPERWVVMDAADQPDHIAEKLLEICIKRLPVLGVRKSA